MPLYPIELFSRFLQGLEKTGVVGLDSFIYLGEILDRESHMEVP